MANWFKKKVDVEIFYAGKKETRQAYVGNVKCTYNSGCENSSKRVFGLLSRENRITHMRYELEHLDPKDLLFRVKDRGGFFYFNVGTPKHGIKISYEELERAFKELGLV